MNGEIIFLLFKTFYNYLFLNFLLFLIPEQGEIELLFDKVSEGLIISSDGFEDVY